MDKTAIKKYAIWARRELIDKVSQKAMHFGIEKIYRTAMLQKMVYYIVLFVVDH